MKHILNKTKTGLTFLLLLMSTVSYAQEKINTPAEYETMQHKSLWMKSSNSAGLLLDNPISFTNGSTSYGFYNGNFHRPQEGEKGNDLNFNIEGSVFVGKLYAWGKFDYVRKTIKDANFNASIIDPFRGMPYIVADANKSEWRNQLYDLSFKVVHPLLYNKLHIGLEANYKAFSGAKQRDPRTENYFYLIHVKPGIVYSFNNNHHVGANLDFFNLKEESVMSKVNTYIDQEYYEMYGLGMSVQQIGFGRTTDYRGNNIGGGIQYNYQGNVNLLLSSDYAYKVEDVDIGFSTSRENAAVKDIRRNTTLRMYITKNSLTHFLTLGYSQQNIFGIESLTEYDNSAGQNGYVTLLRDIRSKFGTQNARLDYDLSIDREHEYDWKLGFGLNYLKRDDIYLKPYSEKKSENLIAELRTLRNIKLSNNELMKRLLIGVNYSYNKNLSGRFVYNGSHADYVVVDKFERVDANFLNSSFSSIGLSAVYSQKLNQNIATNFYAKADFKYIKAIGSEFNNRKLVQITIGCLF